MISTPTSATKPPTGSASTNVSSTSTAPEMRFTHGQDAVSNRRSSSMNDCTELVDSVRATGSSSSTELHRGIDPYTIYKGTKPAPNSTMSCASSSSISASSVASRAAPEIVTTSGTGHPVWTTWEEFSENFRHYQKEQSEENGESVIETVQKLFRKCVPKLNGVHFAAAVEKDNESRGALTVSHLRKQDVAAMIRHVGRHILGRAIEYTDDEAAITLHWKSNTMASQFVKPNWRNQPGNANVQRIQIRSRFPARGEEFDPALGTVLIIRNLSPCIPEKIMHKVFHVLGASTVSRLENNDTRVVVSKVRASSTIQSLLDGESVCGAILFVENEIVE